MDTPLYETRRLQDEYLLFHYGERGEIMPWAFGPTSGLDFPVRTVAELLDESRLPASPSALDLGCAVGKSSFELAKYAHRVIGIDFSHSFIQAAQTLQAEGTLAYEAAVEGNQRVALMARVEDASLRGRVAFEQGDAMHLRADLGGFDIVHAANLLCRLPEPKLLLERLPELVKPGGQLLLTTPCTWLAEFTPPENWPTGGTQSWLRGELAAHFDLAEERDMPFVIREHARKFQWTVAWGSRWVRR
jgi:putative 4-mercaptohistidine N1-methyltranferase